MRKKAEIRKALLESRRQMNAAERQLAARAAAKILVLHPLFKASRQIACYLASDDEFDCGPIIEAVWQAQKKCYVPILSTTDEERLDFVSYYAGEKLELGRYGILEPVSKNIFPTTALDLVVAPLVGFDREANRLGRGKGYYDRAFSFLLTKPRGKPFLLGLGFEQQEVECLPKEEQDVKIDGVLTEHRLIIFNSPSSVLES